MTLSLLFLSALTAVLSDDPKVIYPSAGLKTTLEEGRPVKTDQRVLVVNPVFQAFAHKKTAWVISTASWTSSHQSFPTSPTVHP